MKKRSLTASWPELPEPAGDALQAELEFAASEFAVWTSTSEGREAFQWLERAVLAELAAGSQRISMRALLEAFRRETHRSINNDTGPICGRVLLARYQALRGRLHVRQSRRSAGVV